MLICECQLVVIHPRSESSPNTAALSSIHCAKIVSGSFFCCQRNNVKRHRLFVFYQFVLGDRHSQKASWPISSPCQSPADPAGRRSASCECCVSPAWPDPDASLPVGAQGQETHQPWPHNNTSIRVRQGQSQRSGQGGKCPHDWQVKWRWHVTF